MKSRKIKKPVRPDDLTSWVSLLCFGLTLILSVFYYFSDYETLYLQVLGVGVILLLPLILTRAGKPVFGTLLLCFLVCLLPMAMSVYNKLSSLGLGIINPVNYFDVRLVLISSIIVPMTTIPLRRTGQLLLGVLPSVICLALFDPIHNMLGIGYYQTVMKSGDYYFSANLYAGFSLVFLSMAFIFLKSKIERGYEDERSRRGVMETYMRTILKMGKNPAITQGRTRDGYRDILQAVMHSMNSDAVSSWELQEYDTHMTCTESQGTDGVTPSGTAIDLTEHPKYFKRLLDRGIIIYSNGLDAEDPDISKVHQGYSFIDVIFMRPGKSYGILSVQRAGGDAVWTVEDSLFLKASADILSLLHANNVQRRRHAELERRVAERTIELSQINDELKQYAFLNSHILRAPIARVFGMYQVIEAQYAKMINQEIMSHFRISIEELDNITRKIDQKTGDTFH